MNRVFIPLSFSEPVSVASSVRTVNLFGAAMGTTWSVKLLPPSGQELADIELGVQQQLDLVVAQMSTWCAQSDLSRFNSAAADSWHTLPEHCLQVLDCALSIATCSDGAYDPSVGPLVNLWGFGPDPRQVTQPDAAQLAAVRERCGWRRICLDHTQSKLWQPGGLYLDFSAIAKGYGVDLVAAYLQSIGVSSYLIEVGGELRGYGIKADGQPWWVALEQPPTSDGRGGDIEAQSIVALHDMALATSGDYRRYFEQDGQRYSHTIDPRSGQPIAHQLASVSVLHADCMTADAWATALMVLGDEEGMALAQHMGLAALFIRRVGMGFRESMTEAMQAMLA